MSNNIVLVGMPASGKSTIGVILAKVLGMDFLDCDLVIQKQTGKKLSVLIEEFGVEGFIRLEEKIISSIEVQDTVIATGGSAIYGDEAMRHLKSGGRVLYLDLSLEQLSQRLSDMKGRGVVLKEGQTLKTLYEERSVLYRKYADETVREDGKSIEDMVEEIVKRM